MTGQRGRRAPPKKAKHEPAYVPGRLLDWRDSAHWSWEAASCRYCGKTTNLRDSKGKPSHKTCAEGALTQQAADAADAYQQNGHEPS